MKMEIEFPLPPIFLPYLRDSVVTFCNYATALCNSIKICGYFIKNGLEYIKLNVTSIDEFYNCISKKFYKIEQWCSKESFEQSFNASLVIKEDYIEWNAGDIKGKPANRYRNYYGKLLKLLREVHMYSYARGFMFSHNRKYKFNEKSGPRPEYGYLRINLGVDYLIIILNGQNIGRITGGYGLPEHVLLTTDIIINSSLLKEFFFEEFEKIKEIVSKTLNVFKGKQKENPVIHDILMERILLNIVDDTLKSSITYATNWPSLKLYINIGKREKPSFMMMSLPNTIFDIAKAAIISSSNMLGMRPGELIRIIKNMLDRGFTDNADNLLSDLYILASSILQGNPDVDLLYRVSRVVEVG